VVQITRRRVLRGIGAAAAAAVAPRAAAASPRARSRRPAPIRLSLNESAYGPAPKAVAAVREADATALSLYPDVECEALRRSLAAIHRVPPECIALGAGAGAILLAAVRATVATDRSVTAAAPAGPAIVRAAESAGVRLVSVPLAHDWSHDFIAMRRSGSANGLYYVCNPHNPTASITRRVALDAFLRDLAPGATVIVDETYHDYVGATPDYVSFLDRAAGGHRLIVIRSFSKAYGLAGARVGYAVADPATASRIEVQTAPALTGVAALVAAAALEDQQHLRSVADRVSDDRQEFYNQANARMLRVIDSHANFVMLNALRPAAAIVEHFARNGIDLPPPFAPLDEYIRVSLGPRTDMQEFWRVWDLMALSHTA
jgi:histidinol-phosphate aminotransferase